MLSLFKMARPENILIAILTLAVGCFISGGEISTAVFAADAIAFAFAIAFGNVLNDILDVEIDGKCHPERPIPSKKISMRTAKFFAAACFVFAFLPVLFPDVRAKFHAAFYAILLVTLFLYDRFLKRVPLLKNATVALLCATPIIRAMFLPGSDVRPLAVTAVFAFLLTLSREIAKDLEDVEGDAFRGIETFPIRFGKRPAQRLSGSLVILTNAAVLFSVLLSWFPKGFLVSLAAIFPLSVRILKDLRRENFHRAQKLVKVLMPIGLVAILLSNL